MGTFDDRSLTDGDVGAGPSEVGNATPSLEATQSVGPERQHQPASLDETIAGDEPALREPAPGLVPGSVVGRHFLLQRLGAGGMGVVHAAYDPELDRKVALKLLRPGTAGAASRTRLLREAQALAKLSHPNVVAIYDVGTVGEQVWLAMELVQGQTLGAWLRTPRRWQEVLAVLRGAGEGLAAAHAVGLLHRDFKPDNVMVGDDGRVRVMDFGLARVRPDASSLDTDEPLPVAPLDTASVQVTRVGALVGTPGYMAPEQLGHGELTAAADQFAFCVTAWEALFGQRPFAGTTWMEISDNVLAARVRAPARGRGVPSWLRRACERGLALHPEQRWPSMAVLLERLANGRAQARMRRGLAAVAVLALLGVGAELYREYEAAQRVAACEASGSEIDDAWSPARRQQLREALVATGVRHAETTADKTAGWLDRQAVAWQEARVETCLDASVRERWDAELIDRSLWCLDDRRLELKSLVDVLLEADASVLVKAVSAAAGLSAIDPCRDERALEVLVPPPEAGREAIRAVRADVARASNLELAGRYPEGTTLARDALARAEALQWRPLVAEARYRLGSGLEKQGAYAEAETALADAYFEAAQSASYELAFAAAKELVLVVGDRSARVAEGRHWGRLAELALTSLREGDGLRRARLSSNLAVVHEAAGDYVRAKQLHEQALAIKERLLGPHHPNVASSLSNLAEVEMNLGDPARAKPLAERAVAIYEQELGPDHPLVAIGLLELARIEDAAGAPERAVPLLERAQGIAERALGVAHPHVAAILNNLARAHQALGHYDQAEQLQRRAVALTEQALGAEHPNVATCLADLASIYVATGEPERAIGLLERALAIFEGARGPDHPDVAGCLEGLAAAHLAAGRPERAVPLLERAVAIFEHTFGSTHPYLASPLLRLAQAELACGRFATAVPQATRALEVMGADASAEERAEAEAALAQARAGAAP